jgi:hypothetical protein
VDGHDGKDRDRLPQTDGEREPSSTGRNDPKGMALETAGPKQLLLLLLLLDEDFVVKGGE